MRPNAKWHFLGPNAFFLRLFCVRSQCGLCVRSQKIRSMRSVPEKITAFGPNNVYFAFGLKNMV